MLPNGEVVPIPAVERRGSVQPAPAGSLQQAEQHDGLVSLVRDGVGCLGDLFGYLVVASA